MVDIITKIKEKSSNRIKVASNNLKSYDLTEFVLSFIVFSFIGWIWEVLLHLFFEGAIVNKGTMYGPWLPIYGYGGILMILVFNKSKKLKEILDKPILVFLVIMVLCTLLEYFTSLYLEDIYGLRWWDYSNYSINLHGRISLVSSIIFGLAGILCIYYVAPFLKKQIDKIPKDVRIRICVALFIVFITDRICSVISPNIGEGITMENSQIFTK